eukprot:Clim_evm145s210 gene=Clim_evmTU145s210
MGKKVKTGKARRDKYYHLAKEQGFRARSAFKLIQLNKKFGFLEDIGGRKPSIAIDLCAAPGGWMQVCARQMPAKSLIVGVDLDPIKPIPGAIGFQGDITTEKCRKDLQGYLKNSKADVVLHDGAPNVGTAWNQDAYDQADLTLKALALAVEFLRKGGTFVTKVFRSKDYNSLLWVFKNLFRKVHGTKPSSSRNVSAEIFVVCEDFIAPDKIDPRMLDSRSVFEDISALKPAKNVMQQEEKSHGKKPQAQGYSDNLPISGFLGTPVSVFVNSADPIGILGEYNAFTWDNDVESKLFAKHNATTSEVRALTEDLKVLGKKDFKTLLKWRDAMRVFMSSVNDEDGEDSDNDDRKTSAPNGHAVDDNGEEDQDDDEMDLDDDNVVDQVLEEAEAELARKEKAKRRKEYKARLKREEREALKMGVHEDLTYEENGPDEALFSSSAIEAAQRKAEREGKKQTYGEQQKAKRLLKSAYEAAADGQLGNESDEGGALIDDEEKQPVEDEPYVFDSDNPDSARAEYEDDMEQQLEEMYNQYAERRRGKQVALVAEARRQEEEKRNKLINIIKGKKDRKGTDPLLEGMLLDDDLADAVDGGNEDAEILKMAQKFGFVQKGDLRATGVEDTSEMPMTNGDAKKGKINVGSKQNGGGYDSDDTDSSDDEDSADEDSDNDSEDAMEMAARGLNVNGENNGAKDSKITDDAEFEEVKYEDPEAANRSYVVDAGSFAMGKKLAQRKKKDDVIDEYFNRYAFADDPDALPNWFVDDENKHNKPQIPVTKEEMQEYRRRMRELDARPIKKIAEAKARKKMKNARKLARAQKRAQAITDSKDMSEGEKAKRIESLYKTAMKASKKEKPEVKLVVAKRGLKGRGAPGKRKGVKIKMVDKRMKKESRAMKRIEKRGSSKKPKAGSRKR